MRIESKLGKGLALFGLVGVLAATVFIVNLVWFRPFSLNLFYEKVFVSFVLDDPEVLTSLGIAEQYGWRRHNAHLADASMAKNERDFEAWRRNLADLKSYDLASQTPSQRLSTRILAFYIESQLEGEKYRFHDYPVNQLWGVQSATPEFLISQHVIGDRRGAEDYLARLGEVGRKFDQVVDGLAERERRGILPPRFVLERVIAEMHGFVATPLRENPLYQNFATKTAALGGLSAADRDALNARCVQALQTSVLPAYRKLIGVLEAQLPKATTDDGVWKLPDGDAYYAWRLRNQTTTRLTPQQVHDLGLSEVARLDAEMRSLLDSLHESRPGETPADALARLARDPRFFYPDSDVGRQSILADYATMLDDQLARSRSLIGHLPSARVEVQRVPVFKEKTAPGAYYNPPAIDGSRPGIFFANLRDVRETPKFGMRTLALHEGVPGHHFQISLAQEQGGLPTFRRVLPFTAYIEGWALYAESLGGELGLYANDPYAALGGLQSQQFRAVRLVVDTGIHFKRWSRERAIAYMREKTGMSETEVISEIERYIVDPGQACAYQLGMLSIRAARERAHAALGARFDAAAVRAFHDLVLQGGALPLAVLDEQVDAWIKSRE